MKWVKLTAASKTSIFVNLERAEVMWKEKSGYTNIAFAGEESTNVEVFETPEEILKRAATS